jgi:hypothetical protein
LLDAVRPVRNIQDDDRAAVVGERTCHANGAGTVQAASRLRWAARPVRRSGSSVNDNSTIHMPARYSADAAVLEATTVQARPVRYPAGAVIRPAGQRAAGVVLLLSGTVVATHLSPATSMGPL